MNAYTNDNMSTIALAQVCAQENKAANLEKAFKFIEEAAEAGADIIAFPESFLLIGKKSADYLENLESLDGPLISSFKAKAKECNISLLLGGMITLNPEAPLKPFNTAVLIDRDGQLAGKYNKIHLFNSAIPNLGLCESKTVSAGNEVVVADHTLGKIGLSICYDVRFPSLFQKLREKGAEMIFVPAAFTTQTGKYHWHSLLKARAIETQCYVFAPAQVGQHNQKRNSYGHTVAFDPWGEMIGELSEGEGLLIVEMDPEKTNLIRKEMPIFDHRLKGVDYE
ncbi:MAG: carbon-nitrogen hydrolase family protein [SAR324 cluster bacterium]|nr:carbon-nitrogen hydrolase family protein [SAR324 cluster bacterium]